MPTTTQELPRERWQPFFDAVSRTLPLDRVGALKTAVAAAVKAELPRAEVGVDAAPRALDNESVQERVMVIARNQGLAVDHVPQSQATVGGAGDQPLPGPVDGSACDPSDVAAQRGDGLVRAPVPEPRGLVA